MAPPIAIPHAKAAQPPSLNAPEHWFTEVPSDLLIQVVIPKVIPCPKPAKKFAVVGFLWRHPKLEPLAAR